MKHMVNKHIIFDIIILLIVFCLMYEKASLFYENKKWQEYDEYCYNINEILVNEDFFTAKAEENSLVLYNENFEIIKTIDFEDYKNSCNIKYIRKEDDLMYFIISAAVDDEKGIVYINNNETNSILDGIHSLKRINGKSYIYTTY
ncbi:MAG: hypothetical protein LUG66_07645 [Clostridiales bacterium]|nr:hypothetical protein [Clostridiales bacterium]